MHLKISLFLFSLGFSCFQLLVGVKKIVPFLVSLLKSLRCNLRLILLSLMRMIVIESFFADKKKTKM